MCAYMYTHVCIWDKSVHVQCYVKKAINSIRYTSVLLHFPACIVPDIYTLHTTLATPSPPLAPPLSLPGLNLAPPLTHALPYPHPCTSLSLLSPTGPHAIHTDPHALPAGPHALSTGPHTLPAGPHTLSAGPHVFPTGPHAFHTGPHTLPAGCGVGPPWP